MRREGTSTDESQATAGCSLIGCRSREHPRPIRPRSLLPAVLTAAGVALLAAGLLSYTGSAVGRRPRRLRRRRATAVTADPSRRPRPADAAPAGRLPSGDRCRRPARTRTASRPGSSSRRSGSTSRSSSPAAARRPTRCATSRCTSPTRGSASPAGAKATYIYAHARDGMFGPIYDRAIQKQHGGPNVDDRDDRPGLHERRPDVRVPDHEGAAPPADPRRAARREDEQLWLQTSEGPKGTPGKTQLVARAAARPPGRPRHRQPDPAPGRLRLTSAARAGRQIQSIRWRTHAAPTETRTRTR